MYVKMHIIPLFCLLLQLVAPPLCARECQGGDVRELPFKEGETLTYVLNYTFGGVNTDVGEGVARLNYNDGVFNAVVKGRTFKFYDLFFKVREHFESDFSESTLRPLRFYRNAQEGKYKVTNEFRFNDTLDRLYITVQKRDKPQKDTLLTDIRNTYDLVSLFYSCRTIDFSKVEKEVKQPITFAIDREKYNLYFIYHGEEIKKIRGLGTFKTMKFTARLVAGEVFTGEDELFIWITADGNKIPLLFESKVLVGTVYGRLKEFGNLKYPLSSKIK